MRIIAIDPGPNESAYVVIEEGKIAEFGKEGNGILRIALNHPRLLNSIVAIEKIASYGMAVGQEVFETAVWHGRFWECVASRDFTVRRPTRKEVVLHVCGSARAKDANVRQAMIDRWGPQGTKKNPGPTYGISKDVWAALAIATWAMEQSR